MLGIIYQNSKYGCFSDGLPGVGLNDEFSIYFLTYFFFLAHYYQGNDIVFIL